MVRTASRLCYCVLPKNWNLMWRRKLKLYLCASKIWFSVLLRSNPWCLFLCHPRCAPQFTSPKSRGTEMKRFTSKALSFNMYLKRPPMTRVRKWPTKTNKVIGVKVDVESNTCQCWCERSGLQNHVRFEFLKKKKKTSKMLHLWSTGGGSRHR